jgi:CRISPR-associated exonuclease Cas4
VTIPLVLLAVAIVTYVVLRKLAANQRRSLGMEKGELIAADDAQLGLATLRSERLGLVGRPDQIVRVGRSYIPVEQKPTARRLYPSHAMQVAAQCILVQEVYGVRPPYGVVALNGGRAEQVAFTPQLERDVHEAMREMRRILTTGNHPGPRWVAARCTPCGYRDVCWSQETTS